MLSSELLIESLSCISFDIIFIRFFSYQMQLHMQERKRLSWKVIYLLALTGIVWILGYTQLYFAWILLPEHLLIILTRTVKIGVFQHITGRRCQRIIMGGGELVWHRLFNMLVSVCLMVILSFYCSYPFSTLQMAKYFTAYRIDHILGFFRIWELPDHAATGLLGKFRPSIPLSQVSFCICWANQNGPEKTFGLVYLTCPWLSGGVSKWRTMGFQ